MSSLTAVVDSVASVEAGGKVASSTVVIAGCCCSGVVISELTFGLFVTKVSLCWVLP